MLAIKKVVPRPDGISRKVNTGLIVKRWKRSFFASPTAALDVVASFVVSTVNTLERPETVTTRSIGSARQILLGFHSQSHSYISTINNCLYLPHFWPHWTMFFSYDIIFIQLIDLRSNLGSTWL